MSYQNGTTHYNLPQTRGTDKRDWSDTNAAFANLDTAVYNAATDASTAASSVSALNTRLTTQESKMTTAEGKISTLEASDSAQDTTLLQHGQSITALQNADTAMGNRVTKLEQSTPYRTVNTDGVKTRVQCLAELLNGATLTLNSKVVIKPTTGSTYGTVFPISDINAKQFSNATPAGGVRVETISTTAWYRLLLTSGSQVSFIDLTADVPTVGAKYELYL